MHGDYIVTPPNFESRNPRPTCWINEIEKLTPLDAARGGGEWRRLESDRLLGEGASESSGNVARRNPRSEQETRNRHFCAPSSARAATVAVALALIGGVLLGAYCSLYPVKQEYGIDGFTAPTLRRISGSFLYKVN